MIKESKNRRSVNKKQKSTLGQRVISFMQSLLQKMSFYLCLRPMNNEDIMIPSAAVTA